MSKVELGELRVAIGVQVAELGRERALELVPGHVEYFDVLDVSELGWQAARDVVPRKVDPREIRERVDPRPV